MGQQGNGQVASSPQWAVVSSSRTNREITIWRWLKVAGPSDSLPQFGQKKEHSRKRLLCQTIFRRAQVHRLGPFYVWTMPVQYATPRWLKPPPKVSCRATKPTLTKLELDISSLLLVQSGRPVVVLMHTHGRHQMNRAISHQRKRLWVSDSDFIPMIRLKPI